MSRAKRAPRGLAALYRVLLVAPPSNDVQLPLPGVAAPPHPRFRHAGRCIEPGCPDCQDGTPHPWERAKAE